MTKSVFVVAMIAMVACSNTSQADVKCSTRQALSSTKISRPKNEVLARERLAQFSREESFAILDSKDAESFERFDVTLYRNDFMISVADTIEGDQLAVAVYPLCGCYTDTQAPKKVAVGLIRDLAQRIGT